jgi:hypothetical protein
LNDNVEQEVEMKLKRRTRQAIGVSMILVFFVGLYLAVASSIGFKDTALMMLGSFSLAGFLVYAITLTVQ